MIDCEKCAFKHIVPIPTPAELDRLYRQDFYAVEKPLYFDNYKADLQWLNLTYRGLYELFEKRLPLDRRSILDVGSGPGYFLLLGRQRGWKTLGVEPSAQAAAYARGLGLEILEQFLDDEAVARLGTFDAVTLFIVLEHIPDPAQLLRRIHRLLKPGGLFCVTTANDYNPLQALARQQVGLKPWWVNPRQHVNYFSHESLAHLVRSCGFEVVHQTTTFPVDAFLLMGQNYVGHDEVGRRVHGMRMALELNLDRAGQSSLLVEWYDALMKRGMGRECVIVGENTAEAR